MDAYKSDCFEFKRSKLDKKGFRGPTLFLSSLSENFILMCHRALPFFYLFCPLLVFVPSKSSPTTMRYRNEYLLLLHSPGNSGAKVMSVSPNVVLM